MIEERRCYFLLCDECPDGPDIEESEHCDSGLNVAAIAPLHGWLVEDKDGRRHHVCPSCQLRRAFEECRLDNGHIMYREGTFSDGTEVHRCTCGHSEVVYPTGQAAEQEGPK